MLHTGVRDAAALRRNATATAFDYGLNVRGQQQRWRLAVTAAVTRSSAAAVGGGPMARRRGGRRPRRGHRAKRRPPSLPQTAPTAPHQRTQRYGQNVYTLYVVRITMNVTGSENVFTIQSC